MKNRHSACFAPLALALIPLALTGQETERSPQTALEDLQDGRVDNPAVFMFEGCPQNDPAGRAVFEAVRNVQLAPDELSMLAIALNWRGQYGDCNYGPLNAWFLNTFREIVRQRAGGAAFSFVRRLPPVVPPDMQQALLTAAEEDVWGDEMLRPMFASVAIFNRPRDRQVTEALGAFRRSVPSIWIHDATVRLAREHGAAFFQSLAVAAPSLPDSVLDKVSGAIATEVRDGRVNPQAPGLAQFREHANTRSGVGSTNRVPTVTPDGRR